MSKAQAIVVAFAAAVSLTVAATGCTTKRPKAKESEASATSALARNSTGPNGVSSRLDSGDQDERNLRASSDVPELRLGRGPASPPSRCSDDRYQGKPPSEAPGVLHESIVKQTRGVGCRFGDRAPRLPFPLRVREEGGSNKRLAGDESDLQWVGGRTSRCPRPNHTVRPICPRRQ